MKGNRRRSHSGPLVPFRRTEIPGSTHFPKVPPFNSIITQPRFVSVGDFWRDTGSHLGLNLIFNITMCGSLNKHGPQGLLDLKAWSPRSGMV